METLYNYRHVDEQIGTSGQPTAAQFQALARAGVRAVINLAPHEPPETMRDEAGVVELLGMHYDHIPVAWDNPTEQDFAAFEQAMQARPPGKTLIHCVANFRVTAFFSLYARMHMGWPREQARTLRDSIWVGSDEPVWEAFIGRMDARIDAAEAQR